MDWLFDHLQFVVIVVLALASWLKKRADDKYEEAEERRVREEMIRGMKEMEEAASSSSPAPRQATPPPLNKPVPPPPPIWSEAAEEAPAFEHDRWQDEALLTQQRSIQERLEKAQKAREESEALANQAREKRLRVSHAFQQNHKPVPAGAADIGIRQTLRNRRQSRRAIALREILGPPVALR